MFKNRSVCVRLVFTDNTSFWKVLIRKTIKRLCTMVVVTMTNIETKESGSDILEEVPEA
jgi:hypothetical protein